MLFIAHTNFAPAFEGYLSPPASEKVVYVRTYKTFLDFASSTDDNSVSPTSLKRSCSDPLMIFPEQETTAFVTVQPPPPPPKKDYSHKIFVGGLASSTDEILLCQFMSQFGPVRNVTVKRNPGTGQSRRYAYVKFFNAPNPIIFERQWTLDEHHIRITKYQVSPSWKNHYYSDNGGEI